MKFRDLINKLDLECDLDLASEEQLDREIVVYTDRQLLPNSAYDFEVEADGDDIELHVTRRT